MNEKQKIERYKLALIFVSLLLISVLLVQGIFWTLVFRPSSKPSGRSEQADKPGLEEQSAQAEAGRGSLSHEGYTLEQAVVMSRHNIRSPLSGKGSVLERVTPRQWFEWSSNPSELSLRGAARCLFIHVCGSFHGHKYDVEQEKL